jgi:hypothetical protein
VLPSLKGGKPKKTIVLQLVFFNTRRLQLHINLSADAGFGLVINKGVARNYSLRGQFILRYIRFFFCISNHPKEEFIFYF